VPSVALLAYDDCALHSLSRASGLLMLANQANEQLGAVHEAFDWLVVSTDGAPVKSAPGVRVLADAALTRKRFDIVFVSTFYDLGPQRLELLLERAAHASIWLRRQWAGGASLAAFGAGSLLLAHAGLLDSRSATTVHWLRESARKRYPNARWQFNAPITESDRILCGSAASSDLPLIQRVISQKMSPLVASRAARLVLQSVGLSDDTPQLTTFLDVFYHDPLLYKIDQWLSKNLSRKPSLEKLSRSVGISPRSLDRLFRRELATTPAHHAMQRRLEAACRLLEGTQQSVYEVARSVGYSDASVFGRAFRRRIGITPAAYRARRKALGPRTSAARAS
jgi:transcriptional regulator GlxA family with amidase domain